MWILPTFGRPEGCQEALDCIIAAGTVTPGLVVVNGDPDPRYRDLRLPDGWRVVHRAENGGIVPALNDAFAAMPDEPWYGWLADDAFVRSGPGWDRMLVDRAGPRGIASPDDGWLEGTRIVWGAVWGGELVRAVGWWMPPTLRGLYTDDFWEAVGRSLGLWRYVPQVRVEHRHPFNGKREPDPTHELTYSDESWLTDTRAWRALQDAELPATIARIREAFGLPAAAEDARRDRAQSRSVMICTPVHRDCGWRYTKALTETVLLLERFGISHRVQFLVGSSNLPKARNELAELFMASGLTDLMFIDADMGWNPGAVVRLLASDKEVLAAVGRKKFASAPGDPKGWCVRLLPGSEQALETDDMGMVRVSDVGAGFMKIARSALERIAEARPENRRPPYYRYFRFNDDDGGEDYEFCRLWRECGGTVWIDAEIMLAHAGEHEYTGRFADLLIVAPAPVAEAA